MKKNVNSGKFFTVVYQRVSEFGDRQDLFKAITEKLHNHKIDFKQNSEKITFKLDNSFMGVYGNFSIIKDNDTKYGNYTITVEYSSDNSHKDIIDEFENTFEKVVYSQEADYEEYEQSYSADREYWIREIK